MSNEKADKVEWGVKDAAQRLAKLLAAKGRKCEVVEGDGEWPVVLVVDGTHIRMREHVRRILRGVQGDVVKNVFDMCYVHQHVMVSKTGRVDLDEIEKLIEKRKQDEEADRATWECRRLASAVIANHPTLINPIGEGSGGGMVSSGALVGVRIHDRHTSGSSGRLNITFNGTLYDMLPEDLEHVLRAISEVERRRNERVAAHIGEQHDQQ